jgi:hypothetical protein
LGRHGAQATHNAGHEFVADRVEQLLPHSPCEGLRPTERHHRRLIPSLPADTFALRISGAWLGQLALLMAVKT